MKTDADGQTHTAEQKTEPKYKPNWWGDDGRVEEWDDDTAEELIN